MEKNYCDMHIHTTYSDGLLTLKEILDLAKLRELKKICISDHDCVDAYYELEKTKEFSFEGEIICGCEFVCYSQGVAIEILGYGIDYKKTKEYLIKNGITEARISQIRAEYLKELIKRYALTIDNYKKLEESGQSDHSLFLAMRENKKFIEIVNKEDPSVLKTFADFIRYALYNPKSMFYQDMAEHYPRAEFIIDKIHELGGLAFIAHPLLYGNYTTKIIESLSKKLDGVECYHWSAKEPQKRQNLFDLCKKYKLMTSGGSDFHGKIIEEPQRLELGYAFVPDEYFDKIKEAMPKHNNQYFLIKKKTKSKAV